MNFEDQDDKDKARRRRVRDDERAEREAIARGVARIVKDARLAKGWKQAELARRAGVIQQQVSNIENAKFATSDDTIKIIRALDLDEKNLPQRRAPDIVRMAAPIPPSGPTNLPLYGCVEAGDGNSFYCLSSDPIDMLPRPAFLTNVPKAYAVMVSGESMVPYARPGWTLYVNPNLPALAGTENVFYSENGEVIVKHLLKVLAHDWRVCQFNPFKEFELKRSLWTRCERIVLIQPRI